MLLGNKINSIALFTKLGNCILSRLNQLGSRLLNIIVILSFLMPNLGVAAQAAVPDEEEITVPRENNIPDKKSQPLKEEKQGAAYQPPVYIHPEPRKGTGHKGLKIPGEGLIQAPIEVSWDGGGADQNWETAENWSNDTVPDANSNVTIDANATVQLNASTTINGLVLGDNTGTLNPTLNFNYDAVSDGSLTINDGDFILYSGAAVTHTAAIGDTTVFTISMDVVLGNADLFGVIDVNSKGYPGGDEAQNGYGPGKGLSGSIYGNSASGAGHGGKGGNSQTGRAGGSTYDSLDQNTDLTPGSGGGGGSWAGGNGKGGDGGGIVQIVAGGTIDIVGSITADGSNGQEAGPCCGDRGAGGGAGGSIYLSADSITGSGTLYARGGEGGGGERSGGGGGWRKNLSVLRINAIFFWIYRYLWRSCTFIW